MVCLRSGRALLVLAAVLSVAGAAGCGGPRYVYFRPARETHRPVDDYAPEGEEKLPPEAGDIDVGVAARGVVRGKKDEVPEESVHVHLDVANRGAEPFVLEPAGARLIDDEGNERAGARLENAAEDGAPLALPPGKKAKYTLAFDLPRGTQFESIGSFRVRWPYRYGDRGYTAETKFIKIEEVEYDYYPGPYYGPYYGPYHYYHPSYYWHYPYHYPYYYRPWYGRWNIHLGYIHHGH